MSERDSGRDGASQPEAAYEFGLFDWIDAREAPIGRIYEERLQLLEYADTAPFVCYHLAEHHQTPLGLAPSPALFLASAAQRTRRIRLGPLVYLLPLYEPLRLIEEVAMLDQLSGGRLELGVGRGVSPYELGYHHVDPAQSRAIFRESLEVLTRGLTQERLSYHGQYLNFDDVPMVLRSAQQPYPPLWYATSTIDSVPFAAEQGMNLMRLGPAPAMAEGTRRYWQVWQEHRNDPNRLAAHIARPRLGMSRQILVAETDAQALAEAEQAFPRWWQSFDYLWQLHGDSTYARRGGFAAQREQETIIAGSPQTVREIIARAFAKSGCTYMTLCFTWGSITHQQALRSLRLFVDQVLPAFAAATISAARGT